MAKCPICGKEYVQYSKEDQLEIMELFKDSRTLALKMFYEHNFNYCPYCAIVEHDYTPSQIEALKARLADLKQTLTDEHFDSLDPKKYFRICEMAGLCYEIIGENQKATFAYAGAEDIVSSQIIKLALANQKQDGGKQPNKINPVFSPADYITFNLAMEKATQLKRLVLGHGKETIAKEHSLVVDFILINTLINLGDYQNSKAMLGYLKQAVANPDEIITTVFEMLENIIAEEEAKENKED